MSITEQKLQETILEMRRLKNIENDAKKKFADLRASILMDYIDENDEPEKQHHYIDIHGASIHCEDAWKWPDTQETLAQLHPDVVSLVSKPVIEAKLIYENYMLLDTESLEILRDSALVSRKKSVWINGLTRGRQRDITGDKMKRFKHQLYTRDDGICQYCGIDVDENVSHVDHVTPFAQGGQTTFDNCVTTCISCNMDKRARSPEFWTDHPTEGPYWTHGVRPSSRIKPDYRARPPEFGPSD